MQQATDTFTQLRDELQRLQAQECALKDQLDKVIERRRQLTAVLEGVQIGVALKAEENAQADLADKPDAPADA